MLFYAKHRRKNKGNLDISQEKRYSVMFKESGTTYCVVNQTAKYHELRKMLVSSTIVLVVFLALATPTIFVGIYDRLQTKMKYGLLIFSKTKEEREKSIEDGVEDSKKKEKNLQFFVWATAIVALLLVIAMLAVNVLFIRNHSHSNSPPSIFTVYYVFFGLVLVGNGLTVMTGMCCIWMGSYYYSQLDS